MLKATYTITLSFVDLFQTIDALTSRAASYEQTARYYMGDYNTNDFIAVEECSDHPEAEVIAKHFREIINKIENQVYGYQK